ncbi:hypothetical protein L9F63_020435 [Diploptera punctata]|uniref:Chemosensory protein n=1 Tax=Diploptera punctata TaxID=6984 RepID=A0AAD8EDM2_DIPPU|nr:hypothetical protein L9F63_020435 [Diploptera punctata]
MSSYLCVFLLLTVGCLCQDKYTTKWDSIDVDEILNSKRLLNNYVKCLLDQGPCTPDGTELRKTLPDALETDCSKCSEKQKEISDKVIQYLIDNRSEDWEKLEAKFDPEGTYRQKYKSRASAQ